MDRLTRKELKTDHFAIEVQHSVEFMADHQKQLIRYGALAVAVIAIGIGVYFYRQHQHTVRQEELAGAMKIQNAFIGPPQDNIVSFPTQGEREKAAVKSFGEIANKYSGSMEGAVAEYYLGTNAADSGNLPESEKHFQKAISDGTADLASVSKLALAQVYGAESKQPEGEKLLHELIDKPTVLVSKEQATFALAHLIEANKPDEARKLLEPFRSSQRAPVSRAAITALGNLPPAPAK